MSDEFWSRVQKTAACWLWLGWKDTDGYGRIVRADGRTTGAHRIAYQLTHGPIDDAIHVLHRCDTPACVRPDHLFLGTHAENMADMAAKARGRSRIKLTDAQVAVARRRVASGEKVKAVAVEMGVVPSTLSSAIHGRHRRRAGGPILTRRANGGENPGVFQRNGRWAAYAYHNGARVWLGTFTTRDEAIEARRELAKCR